MDNYGIYVTSTTGTVHVVASIEAERAFCGRAVTGDWRDGDETISGVASTCKSCRAKMRRPQQIA